jgi:hypothetical protein
LSACAKIVVDILICHVSMMTMSGFSPYHELPCMVDANLVEPMCCPE